MATSEISNLVETVTGEAARLREFLSGFMTCSFRRVIPLRNALLNSRLVFGYHLTPQS